MQKITPFLWYDGNVQEAIDFYSSVFPGTTVESTMPGPAGLAGATVNIEGQRLILFNG
ncbi:MAG: VOC family protein, partial [Gemmatimonadota bacterium]|nr:VOC family protein [Gemmatimonadota bacterium]